MDLTELVWGRWRNVPDLAWYLPAESSYKTAVSDGASLWDVNAQLLAGVYDLLTAANYQRARLGGAKNVQRPKPLPRPGVDDPGSKQIGAGEFTPDEMRDLLNEHTRGGSDVDEPSDS